MTVAFSKAKRENIPLLIACEGGTGSGKTKSALELGTGICDAIGEQRGQRGRMVVVDTENRRALFYADDYDFDHFDLQPPFSPLRFGEILQAVDRDGYDVVIFDSFSHVWSGEGGVKEWADKLEAGTPKPDIANPRQPRDAWDWWKDWQVKPVTSPGNWSEPKSSVKPGLKWLVNEMLRSKAHVIVTLRSEEKMKLETVEEKKGDKVYKKTVVTPAADIKDPRDRWVPECEKRFPYEISLSILFLPSAPGRPVVRKPIDVKGAPRIDPDRFVDRALGRSLGLWAIGAKSELPDYEGAARATLTEAAAKGTDALRSAWRAVAPETRDALQSELDGFKAEAAKHDPPPPPPPEPDHGHAPPPDYEGV